MHYPPKSRNLSLEVIEKIAAQKGVDPIALNPPLHDIIDLEALDAIFDTTTNGRRRGAGSVRFTYDGYEVAVFSNGDIEISD